MRNKIVSFSVRVLFRKHPYQPVRLRHSFEWFCYEGGNEVTLATLERSEMCLVLAVGEGRKSCGG